MLYLVFEFVPKQRNLKYNLWSSIYGDTESPHRRVKPSPSTSPWPDVHLPIFLTIHLRQYIAVYLVGCSMPTLDSWLTHLANPLRCIFQLQYRDFYIAQCLFLGNF